MRCSQQIRSSVCPLISSLSQARSLQELQPALGKLRGSRRMACAAAAAAEMAASDQGEPWGGSGLDRLPGQKRSVALHVAYVGTKFRGLQLSRDFAPETTVEGILELALLKANLIAESNYGDLFKIKWTRSSRTDKGVHSLATVIGVRIVMEGADDIFTADPEGMQIATLLNNHLPDSVKVLSVQRVNKKFNARRFCAERTYEYHLPAAVLGIKCDGSAEDLKKLRYPFHNYTVRRGQYLDTPATLAQQAANKAADAEGAAGIQQDASSDVSSTPGTPKKQGRRKPKDDVIEDDEGTEGLFGAADQPLSLQQELEAEAKLAASLGAVTLDAGQTETGKLPIRRWDQLCSWVPEITDKDRVGVRHYRVITAFTADDPAPLVPGGVPSIRISVTGQSFMLNQIRHMIGGGVAVACGLIPEHLLTVSLTAPARVSVPKAPPHTLILAGCQFPDFRKAGLPEAKVAQWSGDSLQLREQGAAALDQFRTRTLGPELNTLLAHSDWDYFIESLGWHHWDPDAQQQVVAAHDAWVAERTRQKAAKAAAEAAEAAAKAAEDADPVEQQQ